MKRLLIRPGAIGDFVLSLPALEHLRAEYTEVWCAEQNVPLARFADRAGSIVAAGLDRVGVLAAGDVLERMSAFDEIHSWYGAARGDFRELVEHLPFRFYAALPGAGAGVHATEFYCGQVGAPLRFPRLATPEQNRERFAVIHPFASSVKKRWPIEKFRELAEHLVPEHVESVVWCAGPEEQLDGALRVMNLYELGIHLARAKVYIGNDSGITHLAAAVGTPVIALFGASDPAVWAPRGERVRVLSAMPGEQISVADVIAAVSSLI